MEGVFCLIVEFTGASAPTIDVLDAQASQEKWLTQAESVVSLTVWHYFKNIHLSDSIFCMFVCPNYKAFGLVVLIISENYLVTWSNVGGHRGWTLTADVWIISPWHFKLSTLMTTFFAMTQVLCGHAAAEWFPGFLFRHFWISLPQCCISLASVS